MPANAVQREGKRSPLNMKTTPEMRAKLENAAETSGRSLSQEVEARLERSFETDSLIVALVGDSNHSQNLLRAISKTIDGIENFREQRWADDYITLYMCRKAIQRIISFTLGSDRGEEEVLESLGNDEAERSQLLSFANDLGDEALRDLGQLLPPPPSGKTDDLPRRKAQPRWVKEANGRD